MAVQIEIKGTIDGPLQTDPTTPQLEIQPLSHLCSVVRGRTILLENSKKLDLGIQQ